MAAYFTANDDDDLKRTLDRLAGGDIEQMPAALWGHRVICNDASREPHVKAAWAAWTEELRWLRQSLADDGIPAHLHELIVERWERED